MSELINKNDNRQTIRWKLLTGASAMALTAYVASAGLARAEDANRPTLWIELGGQMDIINGISNDLPFSAPFLYQDPVPEVYKGLSVNGIQKMPRFAFGEEGKITFQPEDSDWKFSAGIRYGRSRKKYHVHHQTPGPHANFYHSSAHNIITYSANLTTAAFFDATVPSSEHHMLLDFQAGKDIGIGLLGRDATSTLSAGVRFLDISTSQDGTIYARPNVTVHYPGPKYTLPRETFNAYTMTAHAARSFRGVGPSIGWDASTAIAGNKHDGELTLDWSINGALLFGRQKAKTSHTTQANEEYISYTRYYGYVVGFHYGYRNLYGPHHHDNPLRSKRVTVPNVGATLGLSVKYPNFKFSLGYRYDTFLNAMDTGLATTRKSNVTFQGPYASVSIGLGD